MWQREEKAEGLREEGRKKGKEGEMEGRREGERAGRREGEREKEKKRKDGGERKRKRIRKGLFFHEHIYPINTSSVILYYSGIEVLIMKHSVYI